MITRLLLPALLFLSACQAPQAVDGTPLRAGQKEGEMHKAGLVLISDLQHASAWEKLIHVDMGVPSRKIEVKAGPGLTTLVIHELKNRADAEGIAQGLRQYAEKNPEKFGPTKVEISLNTVGPTISPFVLPTESAAPMFNQGPALPTLSLPPLQPAGR
ncbi:MAG: hypothetical protein ACO1TE_30060 [Prosthecobacter sp.]